MIFDCHMQPVVFIDEQKDKILHLEPAKNTAASSVVAWMVAFKEKTLQGKQPTVQELYDLDAFSNKDLPSYLKDGSLILLAKDNWSPDMVKKRGRLRMQSR